MWFQSNSAGECLFIYVSRNFFLFFVILFGGICVIWLNRFFSFDTFFLLLRTKLLRMSWKADDFGENNTFWFPLVRHFQFHWDSSALMFRLHFENERIRLHTHTHTSCIILLWWRKRSHYTKVRFLNEHSLDALQTQTIFIYYNKFLRVWST